MSNHDYLTVLKVGRPANKQVEVIDGKPVKKASQPIEVGKAYTRHVPDVIAMEALLREIADSENKVLIQGFVKGTEDGKPFLIASKKLIERHTRKPYESGWVEIKGQKYIARSKVNFTPSSWQQLDRDYASGIPQNLGDLTHDEYVTAIDTIMPGFSAAGHVRVASTSGRVMYKGEPLDASGCRYWFQIEDATDTHFGQRLKLQAAANGLGFSKPNKNGVTTLWAIFDPSVFSCERIVFDGKPHLKSDELSLRKPDINSINGDRVDTKLIKAADSKVIAKKFGLKVCRGNGGVLSTVQEGALKLDTKIETQYHGTMTPQSFIDSGKTKVRCQATFRDSNSWNGFLAFDDYGVPRLYDQGIKSWYELSPADKASVRADKPEHQIRFTPANELDVKPIDWLANKYFERQAITFLYGDTQAYKSFICLDLACAIATGDDWLPGIEVIQGNVLYICGEGYHGILRRLKAWSLHNNKPIPANLLISNTSTDLGNTDKTAALVKAIDEMNHKPVLIIVDTFARNVNTASENANNDIGLFYSTVETQLVKRYNCTILATHHPGKDLSQGMRGGASLKQNADAVFEVKREGDQMLTSMTSKKMKDAPRPDPVMFEAIEVDLNMQDSFGGESSSLALEVVDDQTRMKLLLNSKQNATNKAESDRKKLLTAIIQDGTLTQQAYAVQCGFTSQQVVSNYITWLRKEKYLTGTARKLKITNKGKTWCT
jgi:hypothetical protein